MSASKNGVIVILIYRNTIAPNSDNPLILPADQTRRHRGGIPGPCPPNDCLCSPKRKLFPPKRGLCPEEINRLGAIGVQIESQIGVFCGLTLDFLTFFGWRKSPVFSRKKRLNFRCWPKNPSQNQWRPFFSFFFLEMTCFRPEKPPEFPISAEKSFSI